MKKVLMLFIAGMFLIVSASAFNLINQSQLDAVNMTTIPLNYTFYDLVYNLETMTLSVTFEHLAVRPYFSWYEIYREQRTYSYTDLHFWECVYNATISDSSCLIKHVVPGWVKRFVIDDRLSRRLYASYQTNGTPLFNSNMTQYISTTYG